MNKLSYQHGTEAACAYLVDARYVRSKLHEVLSVPFSVKFPNEGRAGRQFRQRGALVVLKLGHLH